VRDAQLEPRACKAHQVRVRVDEPGQHGASPKVDDLFPDARIHLGAAAREGNAPVAHDERVDDRRPRVHGVDAAVLEKHAGRPL
jgi:hypothetical protein